MGYQDVHYEVVDYECFILGETGLYFRGPEPNQLEPSKYFVCLGAAQTFGCFCDRPYPLLLQEELGLACLNLGYGGADPPCTKKKFQKYTKPVEKKFILKRSGSNKNDN